MYGMVTYIKRMIDFKKIKGFEWDKGNREKNKVKHNVTHHECEQIFYNKPLMLFADESHSEKEIRFGAFGKTDNKRKITVFFTLRNNILRVISARDQSKKDREIYAKLDKVSSGGEIYE